MFLSRFVEKTAWLGLATGLMACAARAAPSAPLITVAALSPQDVKSWAEALATAISALAAALNGLAIVWHRARARRARRDGERGGPSR